MFWADNAVSLDIVESDPQWGCWLTKRFTEYENVSVSVVSEKTSYTGQILASGNRYDLVVIDGVFRSSCADAAVEALTAEGVIILDNAEWCPHTVDKLGASGFCRLDFNGFGASNQFTWTTSLFFRNTLSPLLRPKAVPRSLGQINATDCSYMFAGEDQGY